LQARSRGRALHVLAHARSHHSPDLQRLVVRGPSHGGRIASGPTGHDGGVPERLQLHSPAVDQGLSTPSPRRFYINDDPSDDVRLRHPETGPAWDLTARVLTLLRRDERVIVLTEAEQIAALVGHAQHTSFVLTLGIGSAGERVARRVHARTGWFPHIRRVEVAREEDGQGRY